ncbi:MAG: hypothetical protein IM638_08975 [Bacteroidetes bacterium]|nr:hypothetical protein [Bacteroidota bacterium]
MKHYFLAITAVFALLITSCGPTQKDAIAFNDKLVDLSDKVNDLSDQMADQLDGHNLDTLNAVYGKFSAAIKNALAETKQMKPIDEKDPGYYNAAIAHFENMSKLCDAEVKRIVATTAKFASGAEPTEEELASLETDIQNYDSQSQKTMDAVKAEQRKFSQKWDFMLR